MENETNQQGIHIPEIPPAEVRALQYMIDDNPGDALITLQMMSGKDRAVLAYYIHELDQMIVVVDGRERNKMLRGDNG